MSERRSVASDPRVRWRMSVDSWSSTVIDALISEFWPTKAPLHDVIARDVREPPIGKSIRAASLFGASESNYLIGKLKARNNFAPSILHAAHFNANP